VATCRANSGDTRSGSTARGGWQEPALQNAVLRTARATGGLRVFISPLSTLQNLHRGLRGAERALCRRRAREAVPSKTWSIAQVVPSLGVGWSQWTNTKLPSHLNLQFNLCLAVIARRRNPVLGNRLGPAINGGPELVLDPAPPLLSSEPLHALQRASGEPSSPTPAAPIRFGLRQDSLW
jgi:hypothetical protein